MLDQLPLYRHNKSCSMHSCYTFKSLYSYKVCHTCIVWLWLTIVPLINLSARPYCFYYIIFCNTECFHTATYKDADTLSTYHQPRKYSFVVCLLGVGYQYIHSLFPCMDLGCFPRAFCDLTRK